MKEFDFDELDKAVNSLMGTIPADDQAVAKPDDDIKTVTLPAVDEPSVEKLPTEDFEHHNTTSIDDGAPKLDDTADETVLTAAANDDAPTDNTDKKPTPTIAPRRSGRFMDMVHASGDPTRVKKAPSELPSRVGRTVAPSGGAPIVDIMKPAALDSVVTNRGYMGGPSTPAPAQDEPAATTEDAPKEAPEATTSLGDTAAMMATHRPTLTPLNPDTVPEEIAPLQAPVSDESETDAADAEPVVTGASTSPFLADAKVDKRPLGGVGGASDESGAIDVLNDAVPAELNNDLMAIEAGETDTTPVQTSQAVEPKPAVSTPEVTEPTAAPSETTTTLAADRAAMSSEPLLEPGPIFIPQQYQEVPSSGDQSNGAIYDTASYHQPLTHPAKKKSSWWIVLIIVVIILLGAGAGAFAYFQGHF